MRLRWSVKAMMILVAVAALLISGAVTLSRLYRASRHYRSVAEKHDMYYRHHHRRQLAYEAEVPEMRKTVDRIAAEIDQGRRDTGYLRELPHHQRILEQLQTRAASNARSADHHLWMRRKYEHAALHPWEQTEPDPNPPPEPKS